MKFSSKKGFTLIELLVVVAIIGVLASIILSALGGARAKARDARRQSDIKTIQNALEIYYLDNGHYPLASSWRRSFDSTWDNLEATMEIELPVDPVNESTTPYSGGSSYAYASTNASGVTIGCPDGQYYVLLYHVESRTLLPSERGGVTRCDTGAKFYMGGNSFTVGMSPAQ